MALTATPWTPGAHEAAASFVSRRMSLEHPSQAAHPSCGSAGSLNSSQLENLYTAFNQGLSLPGNVSTNSTIADAAGPGPPQSTAMNSGGPPNACTPSAEPQQQRRAPMPKSASDEDVFSAIGGLEISNKRDADSNATALAASAAPQPPPGLRNPAQVAAEAATAAAVSRAIPSSLSAGNLGGTSGNSMAASPGPGGFAAGPSIGDLPHDEGPSRTLFVRNLEAGTDAAELQRAFEEYGEVRTLYTAALARGFIMIVYYDLRAACLAMHSLQGMQLGSTQLDIHFAAPRDGSPEQHEGHVTLYNLDPSVSLEKLYQSFVTFGDVKDIRCVTGRPNAKLIEYYDVRHATAAYQALSQGVASKRRTKSFDMAALPSVPETNDSNIPTRTSQESLAALTGGTDSWGSNAGSAEIAALASQAAAAALQASAPSAQQPLRALSSSSGEMPSGNIDQLGMAQLMAMQGRGALGGGADAALAGSSYASGGGVPHAGSTGALSDVDLHFGPGTLPQVGSLGLHDAGRQLSAGLPQVRRLSASGSMEHLQRLGSAPLGPGGGNPNYGSRGSLPGSMSSGGLPGGVTPLGGRMGSGDGGLPAQLRGGALSAAAARMHSLGSAGSGSLPPGLGYDANARDGGPVGASRSANDLAALYEAQQHLAAQQTALLQQQRTLAALQTASLAGSSQQMFNSPSAGSMSPGGSPSAPGWANLQQPQQQQADAQLHQQAQVQAALMQSAGLGGLSVGQLQAFLAAQDAGGGAGGLPRSASTSAVMQQQLAPQMNTRLAVALQAQGIAAQLAGRMGPKDARRSDDESGGSFGGGGGRFARRGSESAAAERRSAQERLYSLDLDRVLAGDDARTTLMIRHIPNKYTQKMLLATIDEHFRGTYDFFYLPIDFKNKCNVGYAFINMLRPEYVVPLVERFNHRKWEKFNSEKVCSITYARIQGKNAMVAHFQNSSLLHEDKRCRPVLFRSEGPLAGEPEPFPVGPNSRLRPQRPPARDTHREHKLRERDAAW